MRTVVPVALGATLCLLLAAALRAEEEPSALEVARRTLRDQELTIQLLEKRVHAQDALVKTLFARLEKEFDALRAWRKASATGVDLVKRQIRDLQDALETERERNGLSSDELGKQLMKEQQRHVDDVVQLQDHLSRANEAAEANRLEAAMALQRVAAVEEEMRRLRDHVVHGVRLLGELGPAAKLAAPWLEETAAFQDGVLGPAARSALDRVRGKSGADQAE